MSYDILELEDLNINDRVEVDLWTEDFRETIITHVTYIDRELIRVCWPRELDWHVKLDPNWSPSDKRRHGRIIRKICPAVESIINGA